MRDPAFIKRIEKASAGLYRPPEGPNKVKKKVVKKRVYEFTRQELDVVEEALNTAHNATRADIAALDGACAATLEPHIARAHRFATLRARVFRGK